VAPRGDAGPRGVAGPNEFAGRLDEAAALLAAAAQAVAYDGPPQPVFGADGPGRPGDLGRALHESWVAATTARAREAAVAAARLTDVASRLRTVVEAYDDVDHAARRHVEEC
jgi:hypothetical protein